MKLIFILLFGLVSLSAKSVDSCYTVQLVSKYNSPKNFELLSNNSYPKECKLMSIGNSLTVRCGCFEKISEAKQVLNSYEDKYTESVLSTTYKYRFDVNTQSKDKLLEVQKIQTTIETEPKEVSIENIDKKEYKAKSTIKNKETCYTVQLASAISSDKSLEVLSNNTYPDGCKLMEIGNTVTVRCGCYERFVNAKTMLEQLEIDYKNASLTKTYKYRFDDTVVSDIVVEKVKIKKAKKQRIYKSTVDDEELKLILQVYLYKSDLDNAYKVASLGFERYPNSYYWNEQMAQISKWTNRTARSMKHLKNMYRLKYDRNLEEKLIAYGASGYQYEEIEPLVVSRAEHYPTEENIDKMILVYKKIGSPEKVIGVLENQYRNNPENSMFLTKALTLSLELGDLELAERYVKMIEQNKPYKKVDANLIAKYYYVQQDIENAYESLMNVDLNDTKNKDENIQYYKLETDLGWYLQDNLNAAEASMSLMDLNESRLADYERISYVYQKSNPQLASRAMRRAYSEYKLSYLFYSYANDAINHHNYDELNEIVVNIDEENSPLAQEALFWIIKSKLYAHYEQKEMEKSSLEKALELDPTNYQIKLTLLYYFMDVRDDVSLRSLLTEMAEDYELDSSYYFPMASAYFYLSDINRASYYTNKLIKLESSVAEITEFKFLQAYILQIQNNESAFKSMMQTIVDDLKKEAKLDPGLKVQDEYLSNYLRASIYVHNPQKFSKKLKKSKKYLSKKNYDEISYSWALKNGAVEKSLKIYNQMKSPDLWVKFSKSVNFQEHSKIEDILDLYLPTISMGDASQANEQDGQIALSQSFTFEGYQKNDDNQNAYIHHRDLSKIRSDYLDVKTSYYNREPVLQKYIKISNKDYIHNGYYIDTNFGYYDNEPLDKRVLTNSPTNTIEAGIGFTKIFDRGSISGHVDYYKSMDSYYGTSLSGTYRVSTDLILNAKVALNENSLESTQMLLGGKKDLFTADITWNILNSTSVNILYEHNIYSSQDGVDIGYGDYTRLSLIRQIRNGYPDLRFGAFIDYGLYDETGGEKGVVDLLQPERFPVLPQDFYNLGVTFSYGMANADDYTRVWRPYLEFYPYYNSEQDNYTYGLNVGYGGKVWHQDHLIFGATYSESVSGIGGKIFELFLDYHFMYTRP